MSPEKLEIHRKEGFCIFFIAIAIYAGFAFISGKRGCTGRDDEEAEHWVCRFRRTR
jgi:hypothetical protein